MLVLPKTYLSEGKKISQYLLVLTLYVQNFQKEHNHTFAFHVTPSQCCYTGIWNPSSCKTQTYIFNIGQQHGCWCPGDARSQGISNHDVDPDLFGPRTLRVNVAIQASDKHLQVCIGAFSFGDIQTNMMSGKLLWNECIFTLLWNGCLMQRANKHTHIAAVLCIVLIVHIEFEKTYEEILVCQLWDLYMQRDYCLLQGISSYVGYWQNHP